MDFENIMMQLFPMFPMFPTFTIFASETMGPIYFETFQSLQITNIVLSVFASIFQSSMKTFHYIFDRLLNTPNRIQ